MKTRAFAMIVAAIVFVSAPAAQLPDISWTCPMHPDVLEAKKGACSICGMDLEPVRLVLVYTCPVHAVIEQSKPGKCRICSRDLVQKTAALTFTCANDRERSQLEPGKCPDGSATVPRYTQRAHGDHNPKHGGIFFMAPDNWHHLEGTYPGAGRFRVYIYDDFSRPLPLDQARKVRARVVTKEAVDPKTGAVRELASTPLVLARNGAFLEARLEALPLPAKMTAKISFTADNKESRFDFAFPAYTVDLPASALSTSSATAGKPAAASISGATADRPAAASISGATADRPAAASTSSAAGNPSASVAPDAAIAAAPTAPTAGPAAPGDLLADLKTRGDEVAALLKSGTLGAVYVPALQAKDLALEIQSKQPETAQEAIEASVRQIVIAAYQLDNFGDLGDAAQAQEAFRTMNAAIAQLDSVISGPR